MLYEIFLIFVGIYIEQKYQLPSVDLFLSNLKSPIPQNKNILNNFLDNIYTTFYTNKKN
jgi:hypothetical protein